jgi:hypothetical protein
MLSNVTEWESVTQHKARYGNKQKKKSPVKLDKSE